jgi:APA family basic amino acid/polyamine antiporter
MAAEVTPPEGPDERVTRTASLGLFDATTIVAGSMIGSGIFLVSADVARKTGSPGWLLVVWVLAGALTVAAALAYGELAAMFPRAGGQYVYLREAFGPGAAFLFGWTQLLVIQSGTIAAVAVAFARFAGVLCPRLTDAGLLGTGKLGPTPQRLLAILLVLALTWTNGRGLKAGKTVQNFFTVAKGLVLAGIILAALFSRSHPAAALSAEPFFGRAPWATLGPAMVGALFASDAWNNVTFTAGEVRDPHRNLPRSLLLGTGLVILVYLAVNVSYLSVLSMPAIAHAPSDRVASAMIEAALGPFARTWVTVGVLISTFGCANGLILAGARVSYAMAEDGLFLEAARRRNARRVPAVALWMQAVWASLLCLSGTYSELLDYVVFAVLLFYVLTLIGLFVLRRSRPLATRPYRALGYPYVPAAYIAVATAVALGLLVSTETRSQALAGLALVLSGVPAYAWVAWKKRTTPLDPRYECRGTQESDIQSPP